MMPSGARLSTSVSALDDSTRLLVRLAAVIAAGTEPEIRSAMIEAAESSLSPVWAEELILQTYLFAGFPRGLNAMREWRRASGLPAPAQDEGERADEAGTWVRVGERTCRTVYGAMYERLRVNIRTLHPALDAWMISEGYGKVLSRPGLDLKRRELCIVSACAVLEQERQLHSHLHGAVNAGASAAEVDETLSLVEARLRPRTRQRVARLWAKVRRH